MGQMIRRTKVAWAIILALGLAGSTANGELVAHWKFDEGGGSNAYDSAGMHNGIVNGSVWTGGKVDGALSFNGSSDYVIVGDSDDFESGTGTVAAWIKLDTWGGNGYGRILSHVARVSSNTYGIDLDVRSSNHNLGFV